MDTNINVKENINAEDGFMRQARYDIVGLLRFLGMLFVMTHHLYVLGFSGNYLWYSSWPWVDYFYILTGFFTAKHFRIEQDGKYNSQNISKDVMRYTLKKYKGFAPYIVVSVLAQYLVELYIYITSGHTAYGLRNIIIDMPYELLCLSSTGIVTAKLAPIWYLSGMLIALPIVVYLMLKFKDIWYIFSWVVPVLYYGKYGVNTIREWPNDMIRAFVCIVLGTFVYLLAVQLNKIEIHSKLKKIALTVCEVGCWAAVVYITGLNKNMLNLTVLLFVVHCTIMFSGKSMTYHIKSRFFSYLGQLSLPLFLIHWPIAYLVNMMECDIMIKVILYYGLSIIVSIILLWINNKVKNLRKR